MIENLLLQLQLTFSLIKTNAPLSLSILSGFWLIHIINFLLGYRLNILGIYPRHIGGIVGIFFSPFLHADFEHLFFNSIPFFILINFVLISAPQQFVDISVAIILISGILTWLFGRRAIHVGASGLIMGYWSYLLMNAYQHISVMTVMLAVVCFYYLGGLALNLFPTEERVSWEAHVFGFLAGLAVAYVGIFNF